MKYLHLNAIGVLCIYIVSISTQKVNAYDDLISSASPIIDMSSSPHPMMTKSSYIASMTEEIDGPATVSGKTSFSNLWSSITSTLTLTVITEFGDRTFILAATYALQGSKMTTLTATSLALVIQTFLSVLAGQILHFLPTSLKKSNGWLSMPFDDYGAAVLLFMFGFLHFRAAYKYKQPSHDLKLPQNVKSYSARNLENNSVNPEILGSTELSFNHYPSRSCSQTSICRDSIDIPYIEFPNTNKGILENQTNKLIETRKNKATSLISSASSASVIPIQTCISPEEPEEKISSLHSFTYIFGVIFAAELGDKSMFSTIALSTAQNPYGVFIGGSMAHILMTLLAVTLGGLLNGIISERLLNYVGAFLFIIFAIMTIMEGLARQGIHVG